jgi:hypothetical protein
MKLDFNNINELEHTKVVQCLTALYSIYAVYLFFNISRR